MANLLMTSENAIRIKNGLKSQTRRTAGLEAVNKKPDEWKFLSVNKDAEFIFGTIDTIPKIAICKPRFAVSYTVGIREPYYMYGRWIPIIKKGKPAWKFESLNNRVFYPDTLPSWYQVNHGISDAIGWYLRPGLFMHNEHIRTHVRIEAVGCERLQDISYEDIGAEGVNIIGPIPLNTAYLLTGAKNEDDLKRQLFPMEFAGLWDSINEKTMPWSFNPWVFKYQFKLEVSDVK
jgi:hypothetical protein